MKTRLVMVVLLMVVLLACGGNESGDAVSVAEVSKPDARPEATEIDPCAILDEELVRAHFEIGEAELTSRQSTSTHHPLCRVAWAKPDAAEIEKKAQEGMAEYIKAKARGEDAKMPSFQTENEVHLTVNFPPSETSEGAAASFGSAMQVLEQGIQDRDNPDAPPKFKYDTVLVEGVGENARWAPKLSQLSVQSGLYVFHVGVRTGDPEVNKEKAMALAADIAKKLGD